MKCKKCNKRFSEAGNIRNYKIVCPYCNYSEEFSKRNTGVSRTKVRFIIGKIKK
jgi:phage FluMu protein Com